MVRMRLDPCSCTPRIDPGGLTRKKEGEVESKKEGTEFGNFGDGIIVCYHYLSSQFADLNVSRNLTTLAHCYVSALIQGRT